MKTNLPVVVGELFRRTLEDNFKEISEFMKKHKTLDQKFIDEYFKKELLTINENNYKQLQKEIRAIVLPEMSPLEVTNQVENSKTDLNGQKHASLSKRLQKDFNLMKEALDKKQSDNKVIVTENGTIMHDFTSKSKIRKVKKIACIGDSVARGSRAKKNYGQMLAEKLGAKVHNLSVSGATMSTVNANSIYEQATKVRDADLVILQGTDDDWLTGGGIPNGGVIIGKDKTDLKTFYGAFHQAIKTLKLFNKDADIIVMTATRQLPVNGTTIRRMDTEKNRHGLTLEDYVNAQVLACTELNVPVFDAYHTDLIDPYNPAFRAKCMVDGLHPNELGHEVIMYELIKNYYYFYG
ncbi:MULTISPECIES: SGNH/GDSL hydrolase family protein [unclassified Mammaliicoccus]|uniref:SGNH/GDSL hydrolase family protein n=1 Tax=unclassified Mammaliicoccus TaxID=2803851 RepID=UPI001EFA8A39|nr:MULTISPECIES: SGNH/GDSL hydrolase family protein [unclassified Mammaliicoccus]